MATSQVLNLTFSPLPSSTTTRSRRAQFVPISVTSSKTIIKSALHFPDLLKSSSSTSSQTLTQPRFVLHEINQYVSRQLHDEIKTKENNTVTTSKIYAILEAISDRIEMHENIKEQRNNWNSLLLNSTNMITFTATLASMLAVTVANGPPALGLKLTSIILFSAAAGILTLMNKIQPSQLVEEQRNAVRLFHQLRTRIQTQMDLGSVPTEGDVKEALDQVLSIDRAYPLPLLGTMLNKFPKSYEPARWWPLHDQHYSNKHSTNVTQGWSKKLEEEMKGVVQVVKEKDLEDYERLGNKALKLSKALAVAGPVLMGMAAAGSALAGPSHPWAAVVAGVCGSLAGVVSSVEHGGQVGMVVEMYRNCGGFFKQMEEDVESAANEKRENGEVFEMKMALRLGRSLSELRDLGGQMTRRGSVDEFANKLF